MSLSRINLTHFSTQVAVNYSTFLSVNFLFDDKRFCLVFHKPTVVFSILALLEKVCFFFLFLTRLIYGQRIIDDCVVEYMIQLTTGMKCWEIS